LHKTSLKPSQSIEARIGLRRETVEVIQPRAWKGLMPIKKKKYLAEREMLYFRK